MFLGTKKESNPRVLHLSTGVFFLDREQCSLGSSDRSFSRFSRMTPSGERPFSGEGEGIFSNSDLKSVAGEFFLFDEGFRESALNFSSCPRSPTARVPRQSRRELGKNMRIRFAPLQEMLSGKLASSFACYSLSQLWETKKKYV